MWRTKKGQGEKESLEQGAILFCTSYSQCIWRRWEQGWLGRVVVKVMVGALLVGIVLGLGGCWGVGETGWGNPDVCTAGQFTEYPSLMMADDVLLLQGDSMRSLYA